VTGRNIIAFEVSCPTWIVWKWFRHFNEARGLDPSFVKSATPNTDFFMDSRLARIAAIHETIMTERENDDNTND